MKFATKRRPRIATAAATLLLLAFVCNTGFAQVMEQVPSDALLVLRVKDLQATSGKLGKFLTDLGVAAMEPGLGDPLKYLQTKANIKQGLNTSGELAFVFRDPDVTGENPDKSMLILIPVTDYAAFVANFQEPKVDGEVTEVKMPNTGSEPGYLANWGAYAALSPSKEAIAKKPSSTLKISAPATLKELTSKDVVLFGNMVAVRAKFLPMLKQNKESILAEVETSASRDQNMAKATPVIKAFVNQVLAVAEGYLRDTDAATLSLNFGAEGISIAMMSEFQPNSYCGNIATSCRNTSEPLLKGLPTGKYLVYGGSINNPTVGTQMIEDFTGPVRKELAAGGPEMQPITDYIDALKEYVLANKSTTFGLVAPAGNLGQEPILQFVSIAAGDAAKMRASQQKMMKSQEELMKVFGLPADTMKSTVTPNSKTVEGVSFDLVQTTVNPDAKDPSAQQQAQVMQFMYGPEGMKMLCGDVQGNLLVASGVPDTVLGSAVKSIKAGEAPLTAAAGTKAVAANLPPQRLAEFYVPVDEIVTTGLTYARQFGAGINMQLPPDLPPIGVTVLTDGTAIRVEGYVPSSLVQSLVAAGMQAAMQMQGGGGGRGL